MILETITVRFLSIAPEILSAVALQHAHCDSRDKAKPQNHHNLEDEQEGQKPVPDILVEADRPRRVAEWV